MTTPDPLLRSPELMNRDDAALLVVDMQAKLLPLIPGSVRRVPSSLNASLTTSQYQIFPWK
jgi:hypothetical protein